MKNIGTFSLGEGSALLSQTGSIDRAAETKLEAGLPVGLQHDSLIHRFTAAKWVSISIELFIWLLSHHSI